LVGIGVESALEAKNSALLVFIGKFLCNFRQKIV